MTPKGRVSPFGHPRIKACSQLPAAYRNVLRPSSPLGAKAFTKCPSALDCKSPCVETSPTHNSRQRHTLPSPPAAIAANGAGTLIRHNLFTMSKSPQRRCRRRNRSHPRVRTGNSFVPMPCFVLVPLRSLWSFARQSTKSGLPPEAEGWWR